MRESKNPEFSLTSHAFWLATRILGPNGQNCPAQIAEVTDSDLKKELTVTLARELSLVLERALRLGRDGLERDPVERANKYRRTVPGIGGHLDYYEIVSHLYNCAQAALHDFERGLMRQGACTHIRKLDPKDKNHLNFQALGDGPVQYIGCNKERRVMWKIENRRWKKLSQLRKSLKNEIERFVEKVTPPSRKSLKALREVHFADYLNNAAPSIGTLKFTTEYLMNDNLWWASFTQKASRILAHECNSSGHLLALRVTDKMSWEHDLGVAESLLLHEGINLPQDTKENLRQSIRQIKNKTPETHLLEAAQEEYKRSPFWFKSGDKDKNSKWHLTSMKQILRKQDKKSANWMRQHAADTNLSAGKFFNRRPSGENLRAVLRLIWIMSRGSDVKSALRQASFSSEFTKEDAISEILNLEERLTAHWNREVFATRIERIKQALA